MELLDEDGYPTEEALEKIENWDCKDFDGLINFIKDIWWYQYGWDDDSMIVKMSTGGWSGNEDIIRSMKNNIMWWSLYWFSSKRGGHYVFERRNINFN